MFVRGDLGGLTRLSINSPFFRSVSKPKQRNNHGSRKSS